MFGGGLPLYSNKGELVGGLGVSGDTSCTDHVVAWKTRHALGLDAVPMGVAPGPSDNLIFDIQNGVSSSGFGHPACKGGKPAEDIIQKLTQTEPAPNAMPYGRPPTFTRAMTRLRRGSIRPTVPSPSISTGTSIAWSVMNCLMMAGSEPSLPAALLSMAAGSTIRAIGKRRQGSPR